MILGAGDAYVKLTARDARDQLNAADASPLPLLVIPLRAPPNNGNRADCGVSRHEQAHDDPHPRSSSALLTLEGGKRVKSMVDLC